MPQAPVPRKLTHLERLEAESIHIIREVAAELNVEAHVLRFWEAKFPQVKPMKRGGGRRFYRPEDLELLRGIQRLLHQSGFTINGAQKILRERGPDAFRTPVGEMAGAQPKPKPTPDEPVGRAASKRIAEAAGAVRGAPGANRAEQERIIKRAIAELEACLALLGVTPENAAKVVASRRA